LRQLRDRGDRPGDSRARRRGLVRDRDQHRVRDAGGAPLPADRKARAHGGRGVRHVGGNRGERHVAGGRGGLRVRGPGGARSDRGQAHAECAHGRGHSRHRHRVRAVRRRGRRGKRRVGTHQAVVPHLRRRVPVHGAPQHARVLHLALGPRPPRRAALPARALPDRARRRRAHVGSEPPPHPDSRTRVSMTELPPGYLLRRPRDEDAQALVDLMVAIDIEEQGAPDTEIEDLKADWSQPRFDKSKDAWTITAPDRSFAGYGWVWDRVPHVDLQADLYVHPKHRGIGLEQVLLDRIEERGREHRPDAPAGAQVTVAVFAMAGTAAAEILERREYERTRTFYRMTIDLVNGYPEPTTPAGIEIRPFRLGVDDREVHATIEDAFAEHFRFHAESHEDWATRRMEHPSFDPSLWLVA